MFSFSLPNDYGLGNQFAEVVHCQFCKDFLVNEFHLFCVQMQQAKGVFQGTKGCFNSPSQSIEFSNFRQGELCRIQIGNNVTKKVPAH